MKLQLYENFNSIGLLILSLANKRILNENSQNEIENAIEQVQRDYSPGFFHTLRKFDYFQKGEHFKTDQKIFKGVDRCVLGREEEYEAIDMSGNVEQVDIFF